MGEKMKIIAVVFLVFCLAAPALANDQEKGFNESVDVTNEIFMTVYKNYGKRVRLSATLAACGMRELSDAVQPDAVRMQEFIEDELLKKYVSLVEKLTEREIFLTIEIVYGMITGYKMGFAKATQKHYVTMTDDQKAIFRKVAVDNANKVLSKQ
ncbi:MAG: hypothetical protein PVF14_20030 [Desulfobacterales bacterium]